MSLELDVHGYTTAMVIRAIQRCIINNPSCRCIEVIHGFNNGSRIKDLLKNKYNIHNRKVEIPYRIHLMRAKQ